LIDAKNCKEEMLKRAKHVTKPKYPREWLGNPDISGIRRLMSGRRFFGQVENRVIKGIKDFEVHKGTICPPNDRPAAGYIDLDVGPENRISLKVFFIPARTEDVLKGPAYINQRVEFIIGFSLLHGYEAFNVKLIDHVKCAECEKKVERRSCEKEVECPRCHVKTKYQEKMKAGKPGKNGSQKC
jgi:DNA-directed RNA polymerase subunit RPC12/RpoP